MLCCAAGIWSMKNCSRTLVVVLWQYEPWGTRRRLLYRLFCGSGGSPFGLGTFNSIRTRHGLNDFFSHDLCGKFVHHLPLLLHIQRVNVCGWRVSGSHTEQQHKLFVRGMLQDISHDTCSLDYIAAVGAAAAVLQVLLSLARINNISHSSRLPRTTTRHTCSSNNSHTAATGHNWA